MLYSEFKCKDVINTRNCEKLGKVCDLEFDPCNDCICQIGQDIILVDISC